MKPSENPSAADNQQETYTRVISFPPEAKGQLEAFAQREGKTLEALLRDTNAEIVETTGVTPPSRTVRSGSSMRAARQHEARLKRTSNE
jgi:hypothetical protein